MFLKIGLLDPQPSEVPFLFCKKRVCVRRQGCSQKQNTLFVKKGARNGVGGTKTKYKKIEGGDAIFLIRAEITTLRSLFRFDLFRGVAPFFLYCVFL